ncbi:MAG: AAA family ATPase [Actinobacteria bacterium]|nr:AAA family ATPase [Actinomycetota bacterium]
MNACRSCGHENADDARFCSSCGTRLEPETAPREERKVVTCLFCDLVGFTSRAESMDPEDVRRLLQPYHARLRSELERFGGTVEKFIGDAVMAVFGAPVAHEDDPERAVRAALAIRDALAEEGELQVRIGITTGEALIALDARPETGEGMASGDVVNTAARLQAAAEPSSILVDEATYRATERTVDYGRIQAVAAKGKASPVTTCEALRARARVSVERAGGAPLVGRERELTLLREMFSRVTRELEPQLLTLVGVPGIGKSRLVFELFQTIEAGEFGPVFWRHGRSLPYGDGVTFWALAEMVKAQAGILESDTAEDAVEKLRESVRRFVAETDEAGWIERQLQPLAGVETDATWTGDQRSEAFAAWRRFFEALALAHARPLVLVFEDLHWADDALLDFVDYLVEWARGAPLLALCTARPELLARRPGWGGGKVNSSTILLSALSSDEMTRLVESLLEASELAPDSSAQLLEHAGGNPLYAEEFTRLLSTGGARSELPETVQGIIAARLDTLPREEKDLLQEAAVLGRVFWLGALGRERWTLEERLALTRAKGVRQQRAAERSGRRGRVRVSPCPGARRGIRADPEGGAGRETSRDGRVDRVARTTR